MDDYFELYQQAEELYRSARTQNNEAYCRESFEYFKKAVVANQNCYYLKWAEAVKWLADRKQGEERKALLLKRIQIMEEEAIKLGECSPRILGETWEALGDLEDDVTCYEKAKAIYEKVVEESPKYSLVHLWLGDCNRKLGRLKSDEKLLEQAFESYANFTKLVSYYPDEAEKESAPANLLAEKTRLDLAMLQEKNNEKRHFLKHKHASSIFYYLKDTLTVDRTLMFPETEIGNKSLLFDMEHNEEWRVLRENPYYKTAIAKVKPGRIQRIENGMETPKMVKVLDLSNKASKKSDISQDVSKFENLEEFILDGNQYLDHLPEELFSLQKLTRVSARNCRRFLFKDLAQLKNLKVLDLTGASLGFLQKDKEEDLRKLLELKNLEELYLNAVGLETVPDFFEELPNLKVLSIDQNPISEFPPVILKLRKLQKLSIWRTYLTKLPKECWILPDLKELYLGENKFDEDSKAEMDEIYQDTIKRKPDFITDYQENVPSGIAFQPCLDKRIKELLIGYSERMPRYSVQFYLEDYKQIIPLSITQLLFGYVWEGKKFGLSEEGKRKLLLYPIDEPVIEFTNDLIAEQSEYFKSHYPSVYIGCLTLKRKRCKLLMVMKEDGRLQRDLTNPDICLEIAKKNGYKVIDFFEFLGYLIPLEESEAESKKGKEKKPLAVQTKEETDEEFSQLLKSFIDAMKEEGETQVKKIWLFNKRCNQFFRNHPEASIASVAMGLTQLGISYNQGIADVTWARTFGTRAKKDS